jgi:tetratricopeptide (TPR) repeat protein
MELKNYMNLNLSISEFTSALRDKFKSIFKDNFNKEWIDGDKTNSDYFQSLQFKLTNFQRDTFNKMDTKYWDISLFSRIFSNSDLKIELEISQQLDKVKEIRNFLAHSPNMSVNSSDYSKFSKIMFEAMEVIGVKSDIIDKIRDKKYLQDKINSKEVQESNEKIFMELKEQGNSNFTKKYFKEAIKFYSQALEINKISNKERAAVFSNRSAANLELYLNQNDYSYLVDAQNDANRCLESDPTFFKGYFRLARVYYAKNKFEKAITYFKKCLIFHPENEEVKSHLAEANHEFEKHKRNQYMTKINLPRDYEEFIDQQYESEIQRTGMKISKEKLIDLLTNDEERVDIIRGHEYRFGSKKCKKDPLTAFQYYTKAAQKGKPEAMYCMASMIINGEGVEKNYPQAINFLESAASQEPF